MRASITITLGIVFSAAVGASTITATSNFGPGNTWASYDQHAVGVNSFAVLFTVPESLPLDSVQVAIAESATPYSTGNLTFTLWHGYAPDMNLDGAATVLETWNLLPHTLTMPGGHLYTMQSQNAPQLIANQQYWLRADTTGIQEWTWESNPIGQFGFWNNGFLSPNEVGLTPAFSVILDPPDAVPEPGTAWLGLAGVLVIAIARRRRRLLA